MLSATQFYENYYGHTSKDLTILEKHLRKCDKSCIVFLAGDSSLDSKYWFTRTGKHICNDAWASCPAVSGYDSILPYMAQDICFHLTKQFNQNNLQQMACINGAVEEATLGSKRLALNQQDLFIRDHITENDILFVSIGGNDIALRPTFETISNMQSLLKECASTNACKDISTLSATKYFVNLFRDQMKVYILKLVEKAIPQTIVVSMIYNPYEFRSGGWADNVLDRMGYFRNPNHLQLLIKTIYELAICKIEIPQTRVVPFAMFEALNSKDETLYCEGVEPSPKGNSLLAEAVFPLLLH